MRKAMAQANRCFCRHEELDRKLVDTDHNAIEGINLINQLENIKIGQKTED